MSGKPTPGPWTIEEYGDDDAPTLVIHKDSESRVCFMATPGSHGDPATIEADARLIAAAPEMLEALKHAYEALAWYDGLQFEYGGKIADEVISAAIAKAEGKP